MTTFALMVTKNEADRYLLDVLRTLECFNEIFVYDDQSTDETTEIAHNFGCVVVDRLDHVPTFLEDEGRFRQTAWWAFEEHCEPEEGDWILCVDADEFFIGDETELKEATLHAELLGCNGISMPIREVWGWNDHGEKQYRIDGQWDKQRASRLVEYKSDGKFKAGLGCGSVPTYVSRIMAQTELSLDHVGYATECDRLEKYHRYRRKKGHSFGHVESIVKKPHIAVRGS